MVAVVSQPSPTSPPPRLAETGPAAANAETAARHTAPATPRAADPRRHAIPRRDAPLRRFLPPPRSDSADGPGSRGWRLCTLITYQSHPPPLVDVSAAEHDTRHVPRVVHPVLLHLSRPVPPPAALPPPHPPPSLPVSGALHFAAVHQSGQRTPSPRSRAPRAPAHPTVTRGPPGPSEQRSACACIVSVGGVHTAAVARSQGNACAARPCRPVVSPCLRTHPAACPQTHPAPLAPRSGVSLRTHPAAHGRTGPVSPGVFTPLRTRREIRPQPALTHPRQS